MIHKIDAYAASCDNCGAPFDTEEYSVFLDDSYLKEEMVECGWYADPFDLDGHERHYCPDCFKWNEEEDDKIILDLSRKDRNNKKQSNGEKI